MKATIKRTMRNVGISSAIIIVVLVGAGVAYTWFMGRTPAPRIVVDTPTTTTAPIKHIQPAANVPESASIQTITDPVVAGSNASVTIRTLPDSQCTISVIYDKTASTDSGLSTKVSDEYGTLTWAWTVETTVPAGKWPVKITCSKGKLSAVVIGNLNVTKQ